MTGLTWKNVTRAAPCPICGKPDWCSRSSDGAWAICRRLDIGTGWHKVDQAGMDYFVYRLDGDPACDPPEVESSIAPRRQPADADTLNRVYSAVLDALELEDHHRADLRARGLGDEEIGRRGYRTLPEMGRKRIADAVREKGYDGILASVPGFHIVNGQYWSFAGAAGLLIPVRDLHGRIAALKTRSDARKPSCKYLYVSSAQYGGPGPGAPVHVPLFNGGSEVVRLSEGELKGDVATALDGILTVSIPGVSAWRQAIRVLRELGAQRIRLAFDGDVRTNRNVARSLLHTANSLAENGFSVELELWDGAAAKGIDDLLVLGQRPQVLTGDEVPDAIAQILEEAEQADPTPNQQALIAARETAARLVEQVRDDKAAPFSSEAISALALLRQHDLASFVRARESFRSAKVPLRELDRAVGQEQARIQQDRTARPVESSPDMGGQAGHSVGEPAAALPLIVVNDRDLRAITADAVDTLVAANDPPALFQRGSLITRIRDDDHGRPFLEPMSDAALRGRMARVADWRQEQERSNGETVYRPVFPPDDVVEDLAALPVLPFPPLLGIIESPVFGPDGQLIADHGYHRDARVWYAPVPDLAMPPVPETPDAADVERARNLVINELLGDFPFVDAASRAHAVGALLQPFLRLMINGPTPLFLVDKPSPGTGASLLADVIAIPATGRPAEVIAEGRDEDEVRKRLTSIFLKAPVYVLLDNIRRRLDSAQLSAAITATTWSDRVLGRSTMVALPILCTWVATGNNVALSNEIARRTALIRLDAKMDRPYERDVFRHPDLRRWAHEYRGDLVWAALVLGRAWLVAGRPAGERTLGGFEAWSAVIGGVLKVAGIDGFLANTATMYDRADEESRDLRVFVQCWANEYGDKEVLAGQLYDLAIKNDLLGDILGDKGERSQRTRLGRALGRMRDRIVGGYLIDGGGTDKSGRQTYRLREHRLDEAVQPADVRQTCGQRMPDVCSFERDQKPSVNGVFADVADLGRRLPVLSPMSSEVKNTPDVISILHASRESLVERMPTSATSTEQNKSPDKHDGQPQVLGADVGHTSAQRPPNPLASYPAIPAPPPNLYGFIGHSVLTPQGSGKLWQVFQDRAGVVLDVTGKVEFFHPDEVSVMDAASAAQAGAPVTTPTEEATIDGRQAKARRCRHRRAAAST